MGHTSRVDASLEHDGRADVGRLAVLLLCAAVMGCDGPDTIKTPAVDFSDSGSYAITDADLEDGPDAAECETDSDCDDGVPCNYDTCNWNKRCIHIPDPDYCDDGIFCNGEEICHHTEGCKIGIPVNCEDTSACTIDSCDEETRSCVHKPRDFDGDGEVDWHCPNGTDCDDFDPKRGSNMREICDDDIDNDCDGVTDESDCGRPEYDVCENALEVSDSGTYLLDIRGAASDYRLRCAKNDDPDVALRLTLSKSHDVMVKAQGQRASGAASSATVALRSDCNNSSSEIDCESGIPGQIRMRALSAGSYFILVSSQNVDHVSVEINLAEPTAPPSNMTCDSPMDVGQGGAFVADFTDGSDEYQISCGSEGSADLIYQITLSKKSDVEISAGNVDGDRMSFAVRTTCDDPDSTIHCISGQAASARLHELQPNTYYIILEGPSYKEVNAELDIALDDPTPPPIGDSCGNAASLSLSNVVSDTLTDKEDNVETSCGFFYPDMIYRLKIDQPTDVGFRIDGGDAVMTVALETECGNQETELFCTSHASALKQVRNLQPNTYYLVVESITKTKFTMIAEQLPLTEPIEVSGNETCEDAYTIPSTGGIFMGDTSRMENDYVPDSCGGSSPSNDAVFRLELTESKEVRVHLDAMFDSVFDTVLYRFTDSGDGADSCASGKERNCDDDGGSGNNSMLDETLDAGVYYYVVDGFGVDSAGKYVLNVEVLDI
jgi:hypothetical protein